MRSIEKQHLDFSSFQPVLALLRKLQSQNVGPGLFPAFPFEMLCRGRATCDSSSRIVAHRHKAAAVHEPSYSIVESQQQRAILLEPR